PHTETFLLPGGYTTHAHLFVRADANSVVFENGSEANNYAQAPNPFDVVPIPYAELAVSGVSADAAAGSGQPLRVTWTVTNQTPHAIGTPSPSTWSDSLTLVRQSDGAVVANLGSFDHIGALAVGDHYTRPVTATLPNGLNDTFYVVVKT